MTGLGLRLGLSMGGSTAAIPAAPVIAYETPVTNPPTFNANFARLYGDGRDTVAGDTLQLYVTDSGANDYGPYEITLTQDQIDGIDPIAFDTSADTFAAGDADCYMKIKRADNGGGYVYSDDSNVVTPSLPSTGLSYTFGNKNGDATDTDEYTIAASAGLAPTGQYNIVPVAVRASGAIDITAVTIDGVSATLLGKQSNASNCIVFALAESSGNTSGNVVVNCDTTALRCAIAWGVIDAEPSTTLVDSATANGTSPWSLDVDVVSGGLLFTAAIYSSGATSSNVVGFTADVADYDIEFFSLLAGSAEISADESPRTVGFQTSSSGYLGAAISLQPA